MNTTTPRHLNHFANVPNVSIPRSKFDLSHGYKTTFDGGWLIPVMVMPVLPGDSVKCNLKQLTRMTTPIVPFMDNVHITFHAFYAPNRILWENWEDYITGAHKGKLGTTHTERPKVQVGGSNYNSLCDYFGLPKTNGVMEVDALPFRMYDLVWSEWYRDQNLQDPVDVYLGDALKSSSVYGLRRRNKRKDYFTSALPWVQKGPDVTIGLAGNARVGFDFDPDHLSVHQGSSSTTVNYANGVGIGTWFGDAAAIARNGTSEFMVGYDPATGVGQTITQDKTFVALTADLSEATAMTINSLREAFAVQHLLERDARNGSRINETLRAHWGVTCPDFRLQRPEFIGSSTIDFMVNSVAQQGASTESSPQGNLAAVAKSVGQFGFQYSAVEHGFIMVLASVTTDLTYQSGINKLWFSTNRFDEMFPEFAHLGEQPILQREIYATGDPAADNKVFGYQERYAEYRYFPGLITGKLRSSDPQSLDYWHLAQEFSSAPTLSETFIQEDPPFDRVLAVQDEPQFVSDIWFDLKAIRPLPVYSVPSLLDHF